MGEFDFLDEKESKNKDYTSKKPEKKDTKNDPPGTMQQQKPQTPEPKAIIAQKPVKLSNRDYDPVKEREKNKFDPRPDLEYDHYIWLNLLRTAFKVDRITYGLLHGLRCAGCQLKLKRNKHGDFALKLDLDNSTELLKMYLDIESLEQIQTEEKAKDQLQMFGNPEIQENKQRVRNKTLAKMKEKLLAEAKKRLMNEEILPQKNGIFKVFNAMKPLIKKAEKDVGFYYLNKTTLNNYFKRMEDE